MTWIISNGKYIQYFWHSTSKILVHIPGEFLERTALSAQLASLAAQVAFHEALNDAMPQNGDVPPPREQQAVRQINREPPSLTEITLKALRKIDTSESTAVAQRRQILRKVFFLYRSVYRLNVIEFGGITHIRYENNFSNISKQYINWNHLF